MHKLLLLTCSIVLIISCKRDTIQQLQILIKNETNANMSILLFPKAEYMANGELYYYSESGGGLRDVEMQLFPDESINIFLSKNLNIQPNDLAAQVFDSLHVEVDGNITIRFTPANAIGYYQNIFSASSTWLYQLNKDNLTTLLSYQPIESHDYFFAIKPQ